MRFRGDPESREQARVVKLYRMAGAKVFPTSRNRAQACAGLPDLYVQHTVRHEDWWHEVKAPGGKLSEEQREFQRNSSVHVVVGGYDAAVQFLELLEIIVPQSKRTA